MERDVGEFNRRDAELRAEMENEVTAAAQRFSVSNETVKAMALRGQASTVQEEQLANLSHRENQIDIAQFALDEKLLEDSLEAARAKIEKAEEQLERAEGQLAEMATRRQGLQEALQEETERLNSAGAQMASNQIRLSDIERAIRDVRNQEKANAMKREKIAMSKVEFVLEVEMKGMAIDAAVKEAVERTEEDVKNSHYRRPIKQRPDTPLETLQEGFKATESEIRQLDAERRDINQKLSSLAVGSMNPSFLQLENNKLKNIKTQLETLQQDIRAQLESEKEVSDKLAEVEAKRRERLAAFLEPLQQCVVESYRLFYSDERAHASLTIENQKDPFKGGVLLSATPPSKKFSVGTESLSAGESSAANVALFLAVNEVMRTPVLFFDEVDAHFDAQNVANFIRISRRLRSRFQINIVTHRPAVYNSAFFALGITKHAQKSVPVCYSLRLMEDADEEGNHPIAASNN